MSWENYSYKAGEHNSTPAGKYRCVILSCEEKTSSKGNDMLEIVLRLSGTKINVKYWIVQTGDYWQDKLNRFFDAFPSIAGNMLFAAWRGAVGAANFVEDENGYLKVGRWIYPKAAESLPEFVWCPRDGEKDTMPEPVEFTEIVTEDDDMPF